MIFCSKNNILKTQFLSGEPLFILFVCFDLKIYINYIMKPLILKKILLIDYMCIYVRKIKNSYFTLFIVEK